MFIYCDFDDYAVISLGNYSTISVPKEVKEILGKDKGERDWGEYLLALYKEAREGRRKRALEELRHLLSEEDFNRILEESKKFREGFRLR